MKQKQTLNITTILLTTTLIPATAFAITGNPANAALNKGGISIGDSGGPVLLGQTNIVLSVHSYASNPNSAGVTYHCRIDQPDVLAWIAEVIES